MNYLFLEIYRVDGQEYAQYIDSAHFNNLKREHGRIFKLPGQKTTQFFVVSDHTIRNEDATRCIERIEKNRVVHIHIDLSEMKVTRYNDNDEREC